MKKTKTVDEEVEELISLAPGLVSIAVVYEMGVQCGLSRSKPSIYADAKAGKLRTVTILGNIAITTEREAERYIKRQLELRDERRKDKMPATARAFFEQRAERGVAA